MHTRMKSHLTKYNSKKQDIKDSSAFYKHIKNAHGGDFQGKPFEELFEVEIVKAYTKPMTRQTEEGIFMINVKGELLNSKTEWHQPKLIRTTVHTGGAELAGGRIVSFPVAGAPGGGAEMAGGRITSFPVAGYSSGGGTRASGPPLQAGGPDPQIDGGRGIQTRRSSRINGR